MRVPKMLVLLVIFGAISWDKSQVMAWFIHPSPSFSSTGNHTGHGFDARFNVAIVKPDALTRKESAEYEVALRRSSLQDLNALFNAIYCDHHGDDMAIEYRLDDEALAEFDKFDEQVCLQLNSSWQAGNLVTRATKERRHVLRWTVILYITYQYTRRALFQAYGPISRTIPKRYVKQAIKLNEYFKKKKDIIEKHLTGAAEETTAKIAKKIINYDGPLVVTNLLRERFSSGTRPSPTDVQESMVTLQSQHLGYVVKNGATIAFVKEVPAEVDESSLARLGLSCPCMHIARPTWMSQTGFANG